MSLCMHGSLSLNQAEKTNVTHSATYTGSSAFRDNYKGLGTTEKEKKQETDYHTVPLSLDISYQGNGMIVCVSCLFSLSVVHNPL